MFKNMLYGALRIIPDCLAALNNLSQLIIVCFHYIMTAIIKENNSVNI